DAGERTGLRRLLTDCALYYPLRASCALGDERFSATWCSEDDEVVAADMADEILPGFGSHGVRRLPDRCSHSTNHLVGNRKAKRVGERLEVIEVEVADGERLLSLDPIHDFAIDRPPTRKAARWIAVRLALHESQQCLDTRAELARVERFGEIVIGAGRESFDLRFDGALRRKH